MSCSTKLILPFGGRNNLLARSTPTKETFGISVVEAIAAGCIPIVPDNSAHCETVPFSELRYKNEKDAKEKISDAINGKFDYFIPRLQEHIQQFSEKNFQDKILGIIKNS